ncbi:Nif3-like dinuclear metal center hexameric protein [Halpernia frigidisoli]|uniref:GTP cyclohydrolase 1 type 2 homolog n=1 Tax=Halpernia frigidisoli TaxID=1125876 RepID=A0A1I3DD56_9FLAO|nr:Nif3-like dinuclear metal center hexameric protein [Halpernia frigidisoli]SFH84529.1 dinuclear metal center protein, YbgI/SA1388 family [Halpernia frigidisoli]
MTVKEVSRELDILFPLQEAEEFDNVGLLCGNPDRNVSGILVCHDALESVIDEAISKNTNLIVTFHPIIFSGLKSITGKNYVEKAVLKAIENKIAIYAIHTSFDNDYFGVNYKICEVLGLKNQQILMPKKNSLQQLQVYIPTEYAENLKESLFEAGAGNIGFYDECSFTSEGQYTFRPGENAVPFSGEIGKREKGSESLVSVIFEKYKLIQIISAMKKNHPYEEVAHNFISLENENHFSGLGRFGEFDNEMETADFLNLIKEKFNLKVIKHSENLNQKIKKVGVLGGSGASGITAAMRNNCDAYLTGDLKYHDFFAVEDKMLLCDIGHFESEQYIVGQLFEKLSQKFTTFAVLKSGEKTNPIKYFF